MQHTGRKIRLLRSTASLAWLALLAACASLPNFPQFPGPTLIATHSPTPSVPCEHAEALIELEGPAAELRVGEQVKIQVKMENVGCLSLGLPQYRLNLAADEGTARFVPEKIEPVVHSLGVPPGGLDQADFVLEAISPGAARFSATVSYEVHLGYPGPAYWGMDSSGEPLEIQILP